MQLMTHLISTKNIILVALLLLTFQIALADEHDEMPEGTTCEVNGVTIPCDDEGVYGAHDPNCLYLHYHGELNGTPDPDEYGCGHGLVQTVAPGAEGSTATESSEEAPSRWDAFLDWADAFVQGLTGGFSPKTVHDTVDLVEDATPSIKANADNAEDYFDAYEDAADRDRYTLEDENPEENAPAPSVYRWFWGLFE